MHFGDEKTKDQNVYVNCRRPYSLEVAKLRIEPEQSGPRVCDHKWHLLLLE